MDSRYNITDAQKTLDTYTNTGQVPTNVYLGDSAKVTKEWLDDFEVVEIAEPHCWRLTRGSVDEPEEAVFSLHGVIVGKDLPPILQLPSMSAKSYPFLRQSVTLTGLGTLAFETAMDMTEEVYNKYRRFFPDNLLMPWQELRCTLTEGRTLTVSNRYFTRRAEAPTLRALPISNEVDPKRLLTAMLSAKVFHSIDNEVAYYTRYRDEDDKLVHDVISPNKFRLGDIVDVQFSFVAYRTRTGQHVLKPMLYSIAFVNGQYSDEYCKRTTLNVIPPVQSLKRKVGYAVTPRQAKTLRMEAALVERFTEEGVVPISELGDMRIDA